MDIENVNQTLLDETISKFSQQTVNEHGWSNRTLHTLRMSLKSCKQRYFLHSEKSHRCNSMHKIISIPGFLSSSIASSLALYIVGSPSSATKTMVISISIFSSFSSVMSAFENNLRYKEQEYNHKRAVDTYGELCRRIEMYILSPDSDAKIVLTDIKKDYDSAICNSPYIDLGFSDPK